MANTRAQRRSLVRMCAVVAAGARPCASALMRDRMVARCSALAAGLLLVHLGAPNTLHAYEDQASVGVDVGYAHAVRQSPHSGVLFGIDGSLGLDDIWTVRAFAGYSLHPGDHALSVASLGAELLYMVDVLEWVPYIGIGLTGLGTWGSSNERFVAKLGVHPVAGVDWLLSRELVLGVVARPEFLITDWNRDPLYVSVALNASVLLDL